MPTRAPAQPLTFERRSPMPVSAAELFAWHLRPGAFERLVPPGDGTRIVHREGRIEDNSMRVVLSVPVAGPVRQRWEIRHEGYVEHERFCDVMERGPFPTWRHEHRAVPRADGTSELLDHIDYTLPLGSLGRACGRPIVERKLDPMFRHRHAVTAGDLAAHARHAAEPMSIRVAGAAGSRAGVQLVAFLLTGGHLVSSDAEIAGYADPGAGAGAWELQLNARGTAVTMRGAGRPATTVDLAGDPVEDPRTVLAALTAPVAQG